VNDRYIMAAESVNRRFRMGKPGQRAATFYVSVRKHEDDDDEQDDARCLGPR
jgi:hypothetical protein